MKKSFVLTAAVCAAMVMASCSTSKESAYKKAYLAAQQQEQQQTVAPVEETPVVAPVEETPVVAPVQEESYENVPVRRENASYEEGANLKAFSVVVGSFSMKSNANDLMSRLQNAGYTPSLASTTVNGTKFYRVISGTYDTKAEAARSKAKVSGSAFNPNSDAWLLAK